MLDCICAKQRSNELPISPVLLSCRGLLPLYSAEGRALPHMRPHVHLEKREASEFPPERIRGPSRALQRLTSPRQPLKTCDNRRPSWALVGATLQPHKSEPSPDSPERAERADFSLIRPYPQLRPCSQLQSQERVFRYGFDPWEVTAPGAYPPIWNGDWPVSAVTRRQLANRVLVNQRITSTLLPTESLTVWDSICRGPVKFVITERADSQIKLPQPC
jgi:hypothetical protein